MSDPEPHRQCLRPLFWFISSISKEVLLVSLPSVNTIRYDHRFVILQLVNLYPGGQRNTISLLYLSDERTSRREGDILFFKLFWAVLQASFTHARMVYWTENIWSPKSPNLIVLSDNFVEVLCSANASISASAKHHRERLVLCHCAFGNPVVTNMIRECMSLT